jgi:hypothetical protein
MAEKSKIKVGSRAKSSLPIEARTPKKGKNGETGGKKRKTRTPSGAGKSPNSQARKKSAPVAYCVQLNCDGIGSRAGKTNTGLQRYKCRKCGANGREGKGFTELKLSEAEKEELAAKDAEEQKKYDALKEEFSEKRYQAVQKMGKQNDNMSTWLEFEDTALRMAVAENGSKNWKQIAQSVPSRTNIQCYHRWEALKQRNLDRKRGPWKKEEDAQLKTAVNALCVKGQKPGGDKGTSEVPTVAGKKMKLFWKTVAESVPNRTEKQCRERYSNHLNGAWKTGSWTEKDESKLLEMHKMLGNKWAKIGKVLCRNGHSVKNRYKVLMMRVKKRKLKEENGDASRGGKGKLKRVKKQAKEQKLKEKALKNTESLRYI